MLRDGQLEGNLTNTIPAAPLPQIFLYWEPGLIRINPSHLNKKNRSTVDQELSIYSEPMMSHMLGIISKI